MYIIPDINEKYSAPNQNINQKLTKYSDLALQQNNKNSNCMYINYIHYQHTLIYKRDKASQFALDLPARCSI